MKKLLFTMASLCAIALTSCQDNEIFDKPVTLTGDAKIKFAAIQNLGTKAATDHPFNNTDDLRNYGSFTVKGYGTAAPIDGEVYVNATPTYNGSSWEYSSEPYWPDQALNFVAYAPNGHKASADVGAELSSTGIKKDDFTVDVDNKTQVDFVVAIEPGKTKESRTLLRFKHTLTQVLFKTMTVEGSNLNVKIENVSINNIKNKGNFSTTFDAKTLAQNTWGNLSGKVNFDASPATSFIIPPTAVGLVGDLSNAVRIQDDEDDNNTLLMLPQNFTAWDTKSPITSASGAYVAIKALITTIVTTDKGDKDVVLWGTTSDINTASAKMLYIPVQSLGLNSDLSNDANDKNTSSYYGQWVPGRRINYIITFGDKDSGSGGGGFDDKGDPVLVPIRFAAMVEDWVDVDVPLLSATVEGASSQDLTADMIDGYTNQVLMDIASTQYPKNFAAKVNVSSTSVTEFASFDFNTAMFTSEVSKLFRPGSTFTWAINATNWGTINISEAPEGWVWEPDISSIDSNGSITLKKVAQPELSWASHLAYIDDHTLAIQKNIEGLNAPAQVTYSVICSNVGFLKDKTYYFETGYLNRAVNAGYVSKSAVGNSSSVTYDFSALDFTNGSGSITMYVPIGWTSSGGRLSSDGTYITIDKDTDKVIVFTMPSVPGTPS